MSNNTIEILTSIHKSVSQIVNNMSPQNGSESVSKLNRGGADTVSKSDGGQGVNVKTDSIKGIVKVLSELSPAVKAIAGLSGRQEKRFKSVIDSVMGAMEKLNEKASKMNLKEINNVISGLSTTATAMHTMMKNMSLWIILAPLALIGATLAIPAFLMFGLLIKIISLMGIGKELTVVMKGLSKSLNEMTHVILKMILVSVVMVALGYFLMNGDTGKLILGGLMVFGIVCVMLLGVMMLTWVASKIVKSFAMTALRDMIFVILGMTLTLAVFVGFAMLVEGHWEYVWKGFALFGLTCLALLAVIGLTWLASKFITNKDAMASIGLMILTVYAVMGIIVATSYLSEFVQDNWAKILEGLLYVGIVVVGIIGLAVLSNSVKGVVTQGALTMLLIAGMAFVAMGVIFGALKLSEAAKGKWDDITVTLLAVTGVLLLFTGLAAAATFAAPYIIPGAVAMLAVAGFALGSVLVATALIKFHQFKEESGVEWNDIILNIKGLTLIMGVLGLLAAAMGVVMTFILQGTVSAAALIIFTMCSINITKQLKGLEELVPDLTSWQKITSNLKALSTVIGILGIVATAMGVVMPLILLGTVAIGAITIFAMAAINIVESIADLAVKIDAVGGRQRLVDVISKDMRTVLKAINKDNLKLPIGPLEILKLTAQYASIAALTTAFVKVGSDISKLARLIGVVDDKGRISPILKIDEKTGEITYGQPADVKAIATTVIEVVKIFTDNLNYGFEDVKEMLNSARVFEVMGNMIGPINSFVEMLTGYKSAGSGDSATLAPIRIDKDGKVIIGEAVVIKDVANNIANTVTSFVTTLFSKENVEKWSPMFGGWFSEQDTIEGMTSVMGSIIEPITNFVNMVTSLECVDGKIRKVEIDSEGKIKQGPLVDLKGVATNIASAFAIFANEILGKDYTDNEKLNDVYLNNIKTVVDVSKLLSELKPEDIKVNSESIGKAFTNISNIMKTTSPVVAEFDCKIVALKNDIMDFDSVLINDAKDRKKYIEELKSGLEDVMSVFKDSNSNISNLSSLISMLETMDKSKVNENADELKKAINKVNSSGGGSGSGSGGGSGSGSGGAVIEIDYDAIKDAVAGALEGMTMRHTASYSNDAIIDEKYTFDTYL